MEATRFDLKVSGCLAAPAGHRSAPISNPVQIILAGAALTDILIRLLDTSRTVASARTTRTASIEKKLRRFERAWEQKTGDALSTAAFYDRYRAGEFNTRFGSRWARYYEARLAGPATRAGLSHLGLHRPSRG